MNGPARKVRFGSFEFDAQRAELRKHGLRIRLQGKPLQVLEALLSFPGEVVTREDLRRRLWPADTFVDFDNGLNTAVKRLRIALGDSAEHPRYVETLARTGYRFIAPLDSLDTPVPAPIESTRTQRTWWPVVAALAVLLLACSITWVMARRGVKADVKFRQLTFRRGHVASARFTPGGQDVVYTATWANGSRELFQATLVSPESRPLGMKEVSLMAVSGRAELALLSYDGTMPVQGGHLSRMPISGGAVVPIARQVMSADWAVDGNSVAVVRAVDGANQLEFPPGRVVYRTSAWLSNLRVAPDNRSLAFVEHPVRHDSAGSVALVDASGRLRSLTRRWSNIRGLAWHPTSQEIWFTAAAEGSYTKSLWSVTPSGKLRNVNRAPGDWRLEDISPDSRVLLLLEKYRLEVAASVASKQGDEDFSWLDQSRAQDISDDGTLVLFDESGEGTGGHFVTYLRRVSERITVRLGEGRAMSLSPDGNVALVIGCEDRKQLRLLPLGLGEPRDLPRTGLEYQWVRFFPDGKRVLALANEPGKDLRLYVQAAGADKAKPISAPLVTRNVAISPDGTQLAVLPVAGTLTIYSVDSGITRTLKTDEPVAPILWVDGRTLLVQHLGRYTDIPARVSTLDLQTGRLRLWKTLAPSDPVGVNAITRVLVARNLETYVFTYRRALSELFLAEGWR